MGATAILPRAQGSTPAQGIRSRISRLRTELPQPVQDLLAPVQADTPPLLGCFIFSAPRGDDHSWMV